MQQIMLTRQYSANGWTRKHHAKQKTAPEVIDAVMNTFSTKLMTFFIVLWVFVVVVYLFFSLILTSSKRMSM